MNPIKYAILETLAFFDLFDRPLSITELHTLLCKKMCTLDEVKSEVEKMTEVVRTKNYYTLYDTARIVELLRARNHHEDHQWNLVSRYIPRLRHVPFIRMVAVCNSLALKTTDDHSDIDLFIIVKKNRIWLTRLLITMVIHISGMRRYNNKIQDRFCLSFFITEESMDLGAIPLHKDDIYFWYWMATIVPIMDIGDTYKLFWDANIQTLRTVLPQSKKAEMAGIQTASFVAQWSEWLFGSFIGDRIERYISFFLKRRALKKKKLLQSSDSGIIISDTVLKFHNVDARDEIYEKWKKRVKKFVDGAPTTLLEKK